MTWHGIVIRDMIGLTRLVCSHVELLQMANSYCKSHINSNKLADFTIVVHVV